MNLSPDWCSLFRAAGWEAVHCSEVGLPRATDAQVMAYARRDQYLVFSHDLDFSAILAATQASAPSVVQVRAQDTLSTDFRQQVFDALRRFRAELEAGAIVVVERFRSRVRILPLAVPK